MTDKGHPITSSSVNVDGLNIHYLTAGDGDPVVFLHGWPASSYLWRKIMEPLAQYRLVIAPDLPGFGLSDKPPDDPYTFDYHVNIFNSFLRRMGVERTDLVVHDLGGPVGLLWAVRNPGRVGHLVIMNTLVHPDISFLMRLLILAARTPFIKDYLASPAGIAMTMKLGVENKKAMAEEAIAAYQAPFAGKDARLVLLKTLTALRIDDLEELVQKLPSLEVPVYIIYGERDMMLANEMKKLAKELPRARVTPLTDCGHFLQEEKPERLSELIGEFLL